MNHLRLPILIAFLAAFLLPSAQAAPSGVLLSGSVKSASGERMAGVTVSAKNDASENVTTSVFTDGQGNYYFPPLPPGSYHVWAQGDGYDTAKAEVELNGSRSQSFALKPLKDFERQLTGDQLLASLPADTPTDRRMKQVFRNNCTSCHQPNYILQNRFDEEGWTAILNLMEHVNVQGRYLGKDSATAPIIEFEKKDLAAYLAKVRGPGESAMKFKLRPRPTGDAARVVFTEYDVPVDQERGFSTKYVTNNGSDWTLGTPSSLNGGHGVHDAQADLNGNIWFTYNVESSYITVGRVDAKTGEVRYFAVPGAHGLAASSHGITRDKNGILWFNVSAIADTEGAPGSLARLDPNTEKIDVFTPPKGMSGVAGTLDVDGKGYVWATTNTGAIRFDPETHQFKEFKSATFLDSEGVGTTYGMAADREGNAWWAEMSIDIVGHSDTSMGKALEVRLPPDAVQQEMVTPKERQMYAIAGSDWNSAMPWAQGPRRLGADKNGDDVWVCDWWGGNLAKIDIHTGKATLIPLPRPDALQPYHATIDSHHNVWVNLMNADEVIKYDPKANQWTEYPLPTLGAETRYVSLLERDGQMEVILPYSRARKVARMTFRTKEQLQALKRQAQQGQQQARLQ